MGFLDRLLGRTDRQAERQPGPRSSPGPELSEEQALERYRYLVKTAPPERIEQAHEEAFAKLTPEQRQAALRELGSAVPEGERADRDDPRSLARMATRAELREPGTVERAFGGRSGMVGGIGGTLLGSFAGAFAGTLIAQSLYDELAGDEPAGEGVSDAETGGEGDVSGGDAGGGDFGGGDFGGGGDAGF
jgi:hypothetical protein